MADLETIIQGAHQMHRPPFHVLPALLLLLHCASCDASDTNTSQQDLRAL